MGSTQALDLSAAQVTVLAIAILIGHNLLVEGAVLHKAGMNGVAFGALRVVAGLAAGRRGQRDHAGRVTVADLLRTFITGSFDLLLKVFIIVIPIMVVLELFEGTGPFRAVVRGWARIVRHVGLDEQSAAPTLIGFLFGLAYGGGVIVRDIRRHGLGRRQVFIMSVFLSMVHAIVGGLARLHRPGGQHVLGRRLPDRVGRAGDPSAHGGGDGRAAPRGAADRLTRTAPIPILDYNSRE